MNRYHRQTLLPEIGPAGQRRLANARVLVAGCGALGCAVADGLARAGVGSLRLVDRDVVEETNLQRQVLYSEADIGRPKATAAVQRLREINSTISIDGPVRDLNARTINHLAADQDVIVDGLDNFETRYLLNDYAVKHGRPYVYAGAVATEGLSFTILPLTEGPAEWENPTACLRCLFPKPPDPGVMPTCDTAGVLGPLILMVAAHEVMQTLKILLGCWDEVDRSLWRVDAWRNTVHRASVPPPVPGCPCCDERTFPWLEGRRGGTATMLCGREAVQITPPTEPTIGFTDLVARLNPHGSFTRHDGVIRGRLHEEKGPDGADVTLMVFDDLRALIGPVESTERAQAIYDRYVGS